MAFPRLAPKNHPAPSVVALSMTPPARARAMPEAARAPTYRLPDDGRHTTVSPGRSIVPPVLKIICIGSLATLFTAKAEATSLNCYEGPISVVPERMSQGVAVNTHVMAWVSSCSWDPRTDELSLHDASDYTQVAATAEVNDMGSMMALRIVPHDLLAPDSTYVLMLEDVVFSVFGTGSSSDERDPELPAFSASPLPLSESGGRCASAVELSFDPFADAQSGGWYEVVAGLDDQFSNPQQIYFPPSTEVATIVGCAGLFYTMDILEPGDEVWVRARSVDSAENASDWTDATQIELPVGCSPNGCMSSPSVVVAVALFVCPRRRAGRRSASSSANRGPD